MDTQAIFWVVAKLMLFVVEMGMTIAMVGNWNTPQRWSVVSFWVLYTLFFLMAFPPSDWAAFLAAAVIGFALAKLFKQ